MQKENYFTVENREEKISEWKETLSHYLSKKKKFDFTIRNTALMIIDMQEYFLNPSSHAYLPAAETIIEPIKKLQKIFEENMNAVFFTQYGLNPVHDVGSIMNRWWKGYLSTSEPLYAISPKFNTENAYVYPKTTYDMFIGTNFAFILSKLGYKRLVITGVTTHLCCENTARSAFNYDFEVYLPIDCMATYTEELHVNSLKAASHGFGVPTTSDELLERIRNGK